MNAAITTPPPAPAAAAATAAATWDAGASDKRFSPTGAASGPSAPSTTQTTAWADTGGARLAATQDDEQRGAKESAGGDPTASDELLDQIAKCLPPQMRPRLPAHRLIVRIGSNGMLAAAPAIDSPLPFVSAEARAEADRVVQAAMQCGPYARPGLTGRVVSMAMDFSSSR